MQEAKATIHLNRFSSVAETGLTPAEAQFLLYEHSDNVGGASVTDLVITGDAKDKVGEDKDGNEILKPRTDQAEKARLARRYVARDKQGKLEIENVFPGMNPKLPATFAEVEFEGLFPFKTEPAAKPVTK